MSPSAEDEALQAAARRAFERVYERSFDRVAAYVLARADRSDAADVVARTFEIAWRRRAHMPEDPLPWLLGIARRVLAEGRRADRRRGALIERIGAHSRVSVDGHEDAVASRRAVVQALSGLTPNQLEALLLTAWDGLSEKQAAAALGCSRSAVAVRLHRARRRLRKQLDADTLQPASVQLHSAEDTP